MKPDIELHIDQLVLEGFTRKEAYAISQSLQVELKHLIEIGGLGTSLGQDYHLRSMPVNSISTTKTSKPEGIGREMAQSIFNGLSYHTFNNK